MKPQATPTEECKNPSCSAHAKAGEPGGDRPGVRSTSEAWQGKVLRNRVVPPVVNRDRKVSPVARAVIPTSTVTNATATASSTQLTPNSPLASRALTGSSDTTIPTTERPLGMQPATASKMEGSLPTVDLQPQELAKAILGHEQTPDMSWTHPQAEAQARLLLKAFQQGARSVLAADQPRRGAIGHRAPPCFDGTAAANWLLQLDNYHKMVGLSPQERVDDAVAYLTGRALSEFALEQQRGTQPRTWDEFAQWVLRRFQTQSQAETVDRLLDIRWDGSLDRYCHRFTAILAEGPPIPEYELVRLFVRRLPPALVISLEERLSFATWTEVRDFLFQRSSPRGHWTTYWMTQAAEEEKRHAASLFPQHFQYTPTFTSRHSPPFPHNQMRMGPHPNTRYPSQPFTRPSPMQLVHPDNGPRTYAPPQTTNLANLLCSLCRGVGHLAKQCPNSNPQCLRKGDICGKCKGEGHWAVHCPTKLDTQPSTAPTHFKGRNQLEKGAPAPTTRGPGNGSA